MRDVVLGWVGRWIDNGDEGRDGGAVSCKYEEVQHDNSMFAVYIGIDIMYVHVRDNYTLHM